MEPKVTLAPQQYGEHHAAVWLFYASQRPQQKYDIPPEEYRAMWEKEAVRLGLRLSEG